MDAAVTEQNFSSMRAAMVESQLRTSGIVDADVIAAMAHVPRERFVPAERSAIAYADRSVPLSGGRAINPPLASAKLLDAVSAQPGEKVLLIGAATGYTAAVLAKIGAKVVAVESDAALLAEAGSALSGDAVTLIQGDLAAGAADKGPYDAIIIDGAVEQVPDALIDQLSAQGRLAVAILDRGVTRYALGKRHGDSFGLHVFGDGESAVLPGFAKPKGFVF